MGGKRVAVGKNDAFNELSSERLDRSGCIYFFFQHEAHDCFSAGWLSRLCMVGGDLWRKKNLSVNFRDNEKDYCKSRTLSKGGLR